MGIKRKLTSDEWAAARRRWEGDSQGGFDWLAAEVRGWLAVDITRQAVGDMARRKGWQKGGDPSMPLPLSHLAQDGKPLAQEPQASARAVAVSVRVDAEPVDLAPGEKRAGEARPHAMAGSTFQSEATGLTPPQEAFALAVAKGLNLSDAYRAAYPKASKWKPDTVHKEASLLAAHPKVGPRVQGLLAAAAKANEVDVALVLKHYLARLNADPRELTEVRVDPCRYCYGASHRYQLTDGELEDERDRHEDKRKAKLDAGGADIGDFKEKGGGGYTVLKEPSPECPSCGGAGSSRVVLKDSRTFSPAALALFGGVKQTKEGIEVKLTDRVEVLGHVARHVGFFEADNKLDVDVSVDMASLDAIYDEAMEASRAGKRVAMGRMERIGAKLPSGLVGADDVGDAAA